MLKDFSLNFLPNSLTASSKLTRYYYELQTRNLTMDDQALQTPLTVSKDFLWNTDFSVNWNLTKNLKFNMSVNNQAEVEETRYSPVNKELYFTEYQHWKDTVSRSLREFGRPLNYNQTANVTWNVPLNIVPFLDFLTLSTQYNALYEWERSTTYDMGTDLGNQIMNQRTLSANANANLVTLYNKSDFLKQVLAAKKPQAANKQPSRNKQPTAQLPGKPGDDQAAAKPAAPAKEAKKFTQSMTLQPDSVYERPQQQTYPGCSLR